MTVQPDVALYWIEDFDPPQDWNGSPALLPEYPEPVKAAFARAWDNFDGAGCEGANHEADTRCGVGWRLAGDYDEETRFTAFWIVLEAQQPDGAYWLCEDCGASTDRRAKAAEVPT